MAEKPRPEVPEIQDEPGISAQGAQHAAETSIGATAEAKGAARIKGARS
jgi:hypothetical protein